MAHIHIGNSTGSGPVAVTLVPTNQKAMNNTLGLMQLATPVSGDQSFSGSFTPSDFMGPLMGMKMADLLTDLTAGNL